MTAAAARQGTSKVLLKLKTSVEAGEYYEAHQMYRTVCNRQVNSTLSLSLEYVLI
jgi:hypothetical protein